MKPSRGTTVAIILAMASICSQLDAEDRPSSAEKATRPNVLMILADDQAYRDFGFMGNSLVHTPNIDRLAAESARYPNGYVPMSVCRPSLATILTGLYPHQHGIHFNHPPPGLRAMRKMTAEQYGQTRATTDYLIENVPTLPRILARHGYACLQTGKHWEGSYRTAGFTHGMTLGRPAERLDWILGTRTQDNGEWVAHGNGDAGLVIGRETILPVIRFVDEHAGKQPFFVWYAPFLPHTPFDAPKRYSRPFRNRNIPEHLMPYYAEINRFDETVGLIIEHIKAKSLLNNTLIVFASDNGFRPRTDNHERQDNRSKLSQFEDGLRTPILLRWDGRTKAGNHPQLVHTIDLVPTVLAAAGLQEEVTPRMSGRNLMPSAEGQMALEAQPVFGAIYPNDTTVLGQPSVHVRGRWIRDGDYKLTVPGPEKPALPLALFNLSQDPQEQRNLVNVPDNQGRVAQMQRMLNEWWPEGDDTRVTQRATESD